MENLRYRRLRQEDAALISNLLGAKKAGDLTSALKAGKTIIIGGVQGPSGKTILARLLNDMGYHAIEEFQTYRVSLDYKEVSDCGQ